MQVFIRGGQIYCLPALPASQAFQANEKWVRNNFAKYLPRRQDKYIGRPLEKGGQQFLEICATRVYWVFASSVDIMKYLKAVKMCIDLPNLALNEIFGVEHRCHWTRLASIQLIKTTISWLVRRRC